MTPDPANLALTDFMDLGTLQEIQDSFAAIASVRASIADAAGNILTQPTPSRDFLRRQQSIAAADEMEEPTRQGREYVAPIVVNGQRLGAIRMAPDGTIGGLDEARLSQLAQKHGLDLKQMKSLATAMTRARNTRPAAIQFLSLLANAIARLCFQEFQLRQRINELTAVYNVTMMLADARDLERVLQRTAQVVAEVMGVRAASIRLLDEANDELVVRAVHNLSPRYLAHGPVRLSASAIDSVALSPRGYEYVRDMRSDPRVARPEDAAREGIVSMLTVGMRYKGRPVGVLRVYTSEAKEFTQLEIDLLRAVASQASAAIENARLLAETIQSEALSRQVELAADVQQRMIPRAAPTIGGVDLAAAYVPCYALGGDLYDFIELPYDNLGLVVADVSGKGLPASLIMASVRAALRAQVDNVYYVSEIVRRINLMLCRDTRPTEFVTLFYGVVDVPNRRLTWCNAGHPAALLKRDGRVSELTGGGMVLGVDPSETFEQSFIDLRRGDVVLLYTDGLTDAMNFERQTFGRQRVIDALRGAEGSATTIAQHVLWTMRRFAGLTQRNDDITLTAARIE